MEYLREVAHLRSRTNVIGAVTRVRNCLAQAVHRFFHERGFYWIHTPIITASDCEGAGEMFRVSTLDLANLPRTAERQRRLQPGLLRPRGVPDRLRPAQRRDLLLALSQVYTFGPTFRAENSNTSRHLSEFWMIEPEIAFADLKDDADLAEDFLHYIFRAVLDERADDMAFFAEHVDKEAVTRLESFVAEQLRADGLHAGRRGAGARRRAGSSTRSPGAWTCSPSTSATCAKNSAGGRSW